MRGELLRKLARADFAERYSSDTSTDAFGAVLTVGLAQKFVTLRCWSGMFVCA
jgi:hypothetical protein